MTATLQTPVLGRAAGFRRDVTSVAGRALRQMEREPTSVIPAVFVPAFFYVVNLGALENVASQTSGLDYKAFLVPMAIAFAVTGMTRAPALVTDIQDGYFDRLCLTPIRRSALLLGLMVADVVVLVLLCVPVLAMGFVVGVRFETGLAGLILFVVICGLWGLVFTGFPYAVALKTGNPAAVNACFVIFFPLFFLTDAVVPKGALTGWFATIATYNPVTYLLGALRSLITTGWNGTALLEGVAAMGGDRLPQHVAGVSGAAGEGPARGLSEGRVPGPIAQRAPRSERGAHGEGATMSGMEHRDAPAGKATKYARVEHERRFLLLRLPDGPCVRRAEITDLYLAGTRLRLRRTVETTAAAIVTVRKLTQKIPAPAGGPGLITTVYLDQSGYRDPCHAAGSRVEQDALQRASAWCRRVHRSPQRPGDGRDRIRHRRCGGTVPGSFRLGRGGDARRANDRGSPRRHGAPAAAGTHGHLGSGTARRLRAGGPPPLSDAGVRASSPCDRGLVSMTDTSVPTAGRSRRSSPGRARRG